MNKLAIILIVWTAVLFGCTGEDAYSGFAISGFIGHLRDQGVDGTLDIGFPDNEDIEYVANFVISKYTSTRIITFFKFSNIESAKLNLQDAMKNPKMSGQSRNGAIIMAATFYPSDAEAVNKIKSLFLEYTFDQRP